MVKDLNSEKLLKSLPWDSEKFGYPVGCLEWNESLEFKKLQEELQGYQLVYLFADQPMEILDASIDLVDIKVIWSKMVQPTEDLQSVNDQSGFSICPFQGKVENDLLELAFQSGEYSRFFRDKRLTNREFEKLYSIWISQAAESGHVFVAKIQGKLIGLVSYRKIDEIFEIGLIAVHPDYRGYGIGKALIAKVEQLARDRSIHEVRIPTQKENRPAMGFYKSLGYHIIQEKYIYHYWQS